MKTLILAAALAAAAPAFAAPVADGPLVETGRLAFQYSCAPCHGSGKGQGRPMLPGTDALNVKYKGEKPPLLEARTDLTPDFVRFIVRHGVESMPSFRKTELSDPNLDAIGAYLARNTK